MRGERQKGGRGEEKGGGGEREEKER